MENSDVTLRWYAAVLVVRCRVGHSLQDVDLLDHQVRIIHARGAEAAYERALALGEAEARTYRNENDEVVTWEFVGLGELDEVLEPELGDGVEVYSWKSRREADGAVLPKEKLAVFWFLENAHRTTRELL